MEYVMKLFLFLVCFYAAMSSLTFIIYYVDKRAAKLRERRISERCLWLLGLLCGWPGAYVGQQLLGHKSSKKSFLRVFVLTVFTNLLLIGALLYWYDS
jgi:uncharacterized membrane protein YsdA (DUF1294 family)